MDVKEIGWKSVDSIHFTQHGRGTVVGSYEHGNELPGSKKGGEFLD
jgi:hypothetical protein